jgi:hypothetical protein
MVMQVATNPARTSPAVPGPTDRVSEGLRAFIIRPFGQQADREGKLIDFDAVEQTLIDPALRQLGYDGRTTQEITQAGNIRTDMFRMLVTADLAIADLSIHNANVFYELGIRHALRDQRTFLIRCKGDKTVFDLQTDRYLEYDRDDPAASLKALVDGLRTTRASRAKDSPVFLLLPDLQVQRRSLLLTVPGDFAEEVERAKANREIGDLELLSEEVRGLEWGSEGLRLAGRAQFDLKAWEGARSTWDALRALEGADAEADQRLGTVHQRLGDLVESDLALRRALARPDLTSHDRAELQSLLGRNAKARWQEAWDGKPERERAAEALRSTFLEDSARAYADGFAADLNHFYSGLNALAMLTVMSELAEAQPQVWEERFVDPEDATAELKKLRREVARLDGAVNLSLAAARQRLERVGATDIWVAISEADLRFLTFTGAPQIRHAYQRALAGAPDFAADAAVQQILLYRKLGIRPQNVTGALEAFPPGMAEEKRADERAPARVLLFTGHMVDAAGRDTPRFPPDREGVARQAIRDAVAAETEQPGGVVFGIAGGASGGDILFHEVCAELGVETRLFLALPPEQFIASSVQPAGPGWVDRFWKLHDRLRCRVLSRSPDVPAWLQAKRGYGLWARNNLWMLHNALALARSRATVIALWDGSSGDGPGGTEDMVTKARTRGAKTVDLNTRTLFSIDT